MSTEEYKNAGADLAALIKEAGLRVTVKPYTPTTETLPPSEVEISYEEAVAAEGCWFWSGDGEAAATYSPKELLTTVEFETLREYPNLNQGLLYEKNTPDLGSTHDLVISILSFIESHDQEDPIWGWAQEVNEYGEEDGNCITSDFGVYTTLRVAMSKALRVENPRAGLKYTGKYFIITPDMEKTL